MLHSDSVLDAGPDLELAEFVGVASSEIYDAVHSVAVIEAHFVQFSLIGKRAGNVCEEFFVEADAFLEF